MKTWLTWTLQLREIADVAEGLDHPATGELWGKDGRLLADAALVDGAELRTGRLREALTKADELADAVIAWKSVLEGITGSYRAARRAADRTERTPNA